MKKTFFVMIFCLSLLASNALATAYDYSDAPGYGAAWHSTGKWQSLGTKWDAESAAIYDDSDNSDDGVFWSVNGGAYGHSDLYVGQTVTFKFDIHKQNPGTHYADFLKSWIDWDHNGFDEGDVIAFDYQVLKNSNASGDYNSSYQMNFSFLSDEIVITNSMVGNLWLRARVTCSESLRGNWAEQWNTTDEQYNNLFKATGHYSQGEVEDWRITTAAPVPEPATLILLGSGLAGLAFYRRRMKK